MDIPKPKPPVKKEAPTQQKPKREVKRKPKQVSKSQPAKAKEAPKDTHIRKNLHYKPFDNADLLNFKKTLEG